MQSGEVATTDGGGAARAKARERSAGRPPVASALLRLCKGRVSVKGLALGLQGKVGNDVARQRERAQVRLGD